MDAPRIGDLVSHLKRDDLRSIGYRLIAEGDRLLPTVTNPVDLHFYCGSRGSYFYRFREADSWAMDEAYKSFSAQIALSKTVGPLLRESIGFEVGHKGFSQMRIIEEKLGNYSAAINLCLLAKRDGWWDNWDHHIERLRRKIAKATIDGSTPSRVA